MSSVPVTVATPGDRTRVVTTVVEAFQRDPAFRFFFADDASYRAEAAAFAGYLFDRRVSHGTIWVVDHGASVAMWEVRSAGATAPGDHATLELPTATLARLERFHEVVDAALPEPPYWYLGILATHPGHAGRKLGRAAMTAGLERAAAEGLPAYLETASETNVELYRRAGWDVVEAVPAGPLTVWIMRR